MSNTTTSIVCMNESYVHIMNGFISFACAFELPFAVKFMQACTKHVVDDMMLFNYLPTGSPYFYLQYVSLARILSKNSDVLPTPETVEDQR